MTLYSTEIYFKSIDKLFFKFSNDGFIQEGGIKKLHKKRIQERFNLFIKCHLHPRFQGCR